MHKLVLLELILDPPKKIVPANYFWIVVFVFRGALPLSPFGSVRGTVATRVCKIRAW